MALRIVDEDDLTRNPLRRRRVVRIGRNDLQNAETPHIFKMIGEQNGETGDL